VTQFPGDGIRRDAAYRCHHEHVTASSLPGPVLRLSKPADRGKLEAILRTWYE
jgi:hypothetical protein